MRTLMLLCLAQVLGAQPSDDPWRALQAANPSGLKIALRLTDRHPFHQGELIKATLDLPEFRLAPGTPPADQWQFAGILLDPPRDCGTVTKPCYAMEHSGVGVGPGQSSRSSVALNSYLPVLPPGRYRLAALARKLVRQAYGAGYTSYGDAEPPEYAVSDTLEIEIVAASPAWTQAAIAQSVKTLNGAQPQDPAGYQLQADAALQLSFLNDPAAWTASLEQLPKQEAALLDGLTRGSPPARVCELMQMRVPVPAQSVSTQYLYRMAEICARANLPPAPVPPAQRTAPSALVGVISTTPLRGPVAPPDPQVVAWSEKRRAYTEDIIGRATAALATSLASRHGSAEWDAFATLLSRIAQGRVNRPPSPDPAWIPLLTAAFTREFPSIEAPRKRYLLDQYSAALPSPALVPLLESVMDGWKPGDYYEAPHSALQALNAIDPERARARILSELTKEKTWLDTASLGLLPPSAVSPMDDALIDSLARAQRPGGWNSQLSMAAIARYATPKALARIRAIYESQTNSCQPELAAYFVRVDPAYADRIFHHETWDMHAPSSGCAVQYFERTPPLAMGPELERYIAAYLMFNDVHVKSVAAHALERYGSAAALPALWDAFRYFHSYWTGKKDDLEKLGEGVQLECDLRKAIAHGRGWLVSETDLRLMESLCVSGRCIGDARQDLESVTVPLRIELNGQRAGMMARIGQYDWMESVEALESKLAQYPRGTRFTLYAPAGPGMQIAAQVRHFAEGRGLLIAAPAH